jgi:hypothetical protein
VEKYCYLLVAEEESASMTKTFKIFLKLISVINGSQKKICRNLTTVVVIRNIMKKMVKHSKNSFILAFYIQ